MKNLIFLLLILIVSSISNNLISQVLPAEDLQLNLTMVSDQEIPEVVLDTLTDPFNLLVGEDSLNIFLTTLLPDTNQISLINVKLGTTVGGAELMSQSFVYDQTNPAGGLTYSRQDNFLKLGLGIYSNTNNALYYAEVELEDANGNKSVLTQTNTSQ